MIAEDSGARLRRAMTERAFTHPEAGDAFEEMLSFWVIVVDVADDGIIHVVEHGGPGELPRDGRLRRFPTGDAFRAAYAYGSIPGYSVSWAKTVDVTGWLDVLQRA
jgi:hypothetical protein